jgi:hypothetical protein
MNKQWTLHLQHPNVSTRPLVGVLSIDENGDARFWNGQADEHSKILAEMVRTRIDWAAADGMMLSGMQPGGADKLGNRKYFYQQWFLRYT